MDPESLGGHSQVLRSSSWRENDFTVNSIPKIMLITVIVEIVARICCSGDWSRDARYSLFPFDAKLTQSLRSRSKSLVSGSGGGKKKSPTFESDDRTPDSPSSLPALFPLLFSSFPFVQNKGLEKQLTFP